MSNEPDALGALGAATGSECAMLVAVSSRRDAASRDSVIANVAGRASSGPMQIGRITGPDGSSGVQSHEVIRAAGAIGRDGAIREGAIRDGAICRDGGFRRGFEGHGTGRALVRGEELVCEQLLERRHAGPLSGPWATRTARKCDEGLRAFRSGPHARLARERGHRGDRSSARCERCDRGLDAMRSRDDANDAIEARCVRRDRGDRCERRDRGARCDRRSTTSRYAMTPREANIARSITRSR